MFLKDYSFNENKNPYHSTSKIGCKHNGVVVTSDISFKNLLKIVFNDKLKKEFIKFYLPRPDISSAYFWHKTAWHEIKKN